MNNHDKELDKLLYGIDKDETEDDRGWWETSTGAEFGAKKLKELKAFITTDRERAVREAIKNVVGIKYPPSGKEYWFTDGTFENSLTGATRHAITLTTKEREKE